MPETFTASAQRGLREPISVHGLPTLRAAVPAAHALLARCADATDLVVRTADGREAWRNGLLTPLGHDLARAAEAGAVPAPLPDGGTSQG